MDPVLSSTLDFDEYIKSNLNFTGQKSRPTSARPGADSKLSRPHNDGAKERPRTGSAARSRTGDFTRNSLSSSYNSDFKNGADGSDLSQDFFQLNISKYGQTKPSVAPPKSGSSRTREVKPELAPVSPTPPVVLQHSWKAHLMPPRPTTASLASGSAPTRPAPSSGISSRDYAQYDDDDEDVRASPPPRPQPALYRSPAPPLSPNRLNKPTTGWSLYSSTSNVDSPTRGSPYVGTNDAARRGNVSSNSAYGNSADFSARASVNQSLEGDFGQYKVRLVTLKRCFATWAVHATDSAQRLALQSRDVVENCVYWPKSSCFTWWRLLTQAVGHAQMLRFRRGLRKWYVHYRRFRRHRTSLRRAAYHHKYLQYVHFLAAMRKLGRRRRQRNKLRRMQILAFEHRDQHLLKRTYATWRQVVAKVKADRLLDEEQSKRRDKISQFMRRVQHPPTATPSSVSTAAMARGGAAVSAASRAEAKKSSTSSTFGRQDSKNPPSTRHADSGPARPERSSRSPSDLAPTAGDMGAAMDDEISDEDLLEASTKERREHSTELDESMDEPAPPSYEQLMRQSLSSRSPTKLSPRAASGHFAGGAGAQNVRGVQGGRDNQTAPPLPPSARAESRSKLSQDRARAGDAKGLHATSGIPRSASAARGRLSATASAGGGISGSARGHPSTTTHGASHTAEPHVALDATIPDLLTTGTFEERAAARRQRSVLLRKQAEERVQEKQHAQAAVDRQKLEREAEEAESIRKEARAKQVQSKAYADRQRADLTEHLKHLLGLAKHFRATQLLVRCGLAPWQRYMEIVRLDNIKADHFRQDRLLQATWSAFLGYIIALRTERFRREHRQTAVATAHHRRKLMRAVWRTFRMHHKVIVAKTRAVTGHFSRFTLCRRSFNGWRVAYERSVRLTARQLRAVQPRGDLNCKRHYWRAWQVYHKEQLEEREIRQRVNSKWATVQGWMNR